VRRNAGSIAPAFNAGLVIGVILFFISYWPHVSRMKGAGLGGLVVGLLVGGALAFWFLGVSLIFQGTGAGFVATTVLLAAGAGAGWVWREPTWLGPVTTLAAAILACVAVNWLGMRETNATNRETTTPPKPPRG